MIKALTRNLHYVFKSLAFITQQGQRFFEVAFLYLRTQISSYFDNFMRLAVHPPDQQTANFEI